MEFPSVITFLSLVVSLVLSGGCLYLFREKSGLVRKLKTARGREGELQKKVERLEKEKEELLSEKEQMAKARDSAVAALDAGERAKSTFLASMSHEIRTPLNCIMGLTEVISQDIPEEDQDLVVYIKSSVSTLLGIVENVLNYAKFEAGNLEVQPESVNINELISETVGLFMPECHRKNLKIQFLAPPGKNTLISTDPGLLRQIIINLVNNSIKFTEKGGITVSLAANPSQTAKGRLHVTLSVSDTGPGIPEDKREIIFKPFEQLSSSTTAKHEGTGLGLSICHRIASEALHGTISVRNNEQGGALFQVEFEAKGFIADDKVGSKPRLQSAKLIKHALSGSFYKLRVLVVDDNQLNCHVMSRMMEKMGHEAEFAFNGAQAIKMLASDDFDLVFMDVMMPIMDGIEATRQIRAGRAGEQNTKIPIIALTAFALGTDRDRLISSGLDQYLSKPVDPVQLRSVLTETARKLSRSANSI